MYAELHALSNFSFLRGASHPEELVAQAKHLDYRALALTDECSLAGVVRAHVAAKQCGLPLIIGAELSCVDALKLVALATDRASYGALSRLITHARRGGAKGHYVLERRDLENALDGCLILWLPQTGGALLPRQAADGRWLRERFAGRLWLGVELLDRRLRCEAPRTPAGAWRGARVAAGRCRRRAHASPQPPRPAGCAHGHPAGNSFARGGHSLVSERRAVPAAPRARCASSIPRALLEQTLAIAERCTFNLEELRYEYPEEIVPAGETPTSHLRALTWAGLRQALAARRARPPCARVSSTSCA